MKCKVGKICGGCAYLSKSMEEQASIKKAQVEELAQRNHLKLRVGDVLTAKNTTPVTCRNASENFFRYSNVTSQTKESRLFLEKSTPI